MVLSVYFSETLSPSAKAAQTLATAMVKTLGARNVRQLELMF
ncbi:hypothetical protein [Veronia nyctiphanis]|nr:hypothetical protein [Veronia nyctiphanis]